MVRHRKPSAQTWRTFLENHVQQLVAIDFLVVPTVSFRLLFVFVVLGHHRRHAIHFNVTAHPTAEWTGCEDQEDRLGAWNRWSSQSCCPSRVFGNDRRIKSFRKYSSRNSKPLAWN
jgi:hypothetical protein